ncbi:MAG: hypothetical protein ISP40_06025 [Alphaproteobacteria bacterium]|nr:hypothetical protein [Alphaproteobacteria bacterium]
MFSRQDVLLTFLLEAVRLTDQRWIDASFCLARFVQPHYLDVDIQYLGIVEAILDGWEKTFTPIYHRQIKGDYDFNSDPYPFLYTHINAVSKMWVLSGYEILRVIYNQLENNSNAPILPDEFKTLFWQFTMVRMETAKYEHARVSNSTGNPTNVTQIDSDGICRVGWRVYCKKSNTIKDIIRKNLAEEFVETFREMKETYR